MLGIVWTNRNKGIIPHAYSISLPGVIHPCTDMFRCNHNRSFHHWPPRKIIIFFRIPYKPVILNPFEFHYIDPEGGLSWSETNEKDCSSGDQATRTEPDAIRADYFRPRLAVLLSEGFLIGFPSRTPSGMPTPDLSYQ
jgi:hypothetical protein